jgi:tetratricopeptide (TPR) repeat protein
MTRTACVVCLLLAASTALGAPPDPTVTLYTDVFDQLKVKPNDPTIMMTLRPPTDRRSTAQREAYAEIVECLSAAAEKEPKNFRIAYNYYQALWSRYLYYGATDDAGAAFTQLQKALRLAEVRSPERARCAFELADNTMTVGRTAAKKLFEGGRRALAVKRYLTAKEAALSRGPYAARASLALAELYRTAEPAKAKKQIRDALELDTGRGFVTNRAYDQFGLVLLAESNVEGALAMLEAAGSVRPDADLKSLGYAHRLPRALISMKRVREAVEYLDKVVKLAEKGDTTINYDLAHTIATGYTALGNSATALKYWQDYIAMGDPDEGRRKRAVKTAQALAIATTQIED